MAVLGAAGPKSSAEPLFENVLITMINLQVRFVEIFMFRACALNFPIKTTHK